MKRLKRIVSLLVASCLLCGAGMSVSAAEETGLYERMRKACLEGKAMDEWVVEARRQIADELGLTDALDERSFLSVEYRNEHGIGRDGEITDPRLDLLVEMATQEEMDAILAKSFEDISPGEAFGKAADGKTLGRAAAKQILASGQTVSVTQMARVSGAGNGYFTVSGANSYGYCAQNKHNFWSNHTAKSGVAYEWNDAVVRKALYYGPGGAGYAGPYYGSLGTDMDYVTFITGYQNGECNNNTKARSYLSFLSGKTDPLEWGYKAYKADIPEPYQDVAFLSYAPVTTNLTIEKRSQTDLYSGDGYKYLSGASFGLYAWNGSSFADRVATSTDNGNGTYTFYNISFNSAAGGLFLVKEEAAKGGYSADYLKFNDDDSSDYNLYGGRRFLLDQNLNWSCYSLRNHTNPGWGFTFLDYPNEVTVTLAKKDQETGEPLTGAAFELWAYREGSGYSYKVGDFKDCGDGSYTITFPFDLATFKNGEYRFLYKETKVPDGYREDASLAAGREIVFDANGRGTAEFVVENRALPRLDLVKKQTGTDIVIPGAVFEHEKPDGTREVLTTDEDGTLCFRELGYGLHRVREIGVMDGYRLNETVITFFVDEENTVTLTTGQKDADGEGGAVVTEQGNIEAEIYDEPAPYTLVIHKQNEQGTVLSGAEFTLYADEACKQDLRTGVTGEDGLLAFDGLTVGETYYLKETKAPAGYRIPVDETGDPVVLRIDTSAIPVQGVFECQVNGSTEAARVDGTDADRQVHLAVVNRIGSRLPETGSCKMLAFAGAGTLLCIPVIRNSHKKKGDENL